MGKIKLKTRTNQPIYNAETGEEEIDVVTALVGQEVSVEKISAEVVNATEKLAINDSSINNLFVKIMPAPESTILTDEQINQIKEGCFINGTFLGIINPLFVPPTEYQGKLNGIVIGVYGQSNGIHTYSIDLTTKQISYKKSIIYTSGNVGNFTFTSLYSLNGKPIPEYPSNTGTFTLKCVNGTLTWVQDV